MLPAVQGQHMNRDSLLLLTTLLFVCASVLAEAQLQKFEPSNGSILPVTPETKSPKSDGCSKRVGESRDCAPALIPPAEVINPRPIPPPRPSGPIFLPLPETKIDSLKNYKESLDLRKSEIETLNSQRLFQGTSISR